MSDFALGVASGVVATLLVIAVTWLLSDRLSVSAGYTDAAFTEVFVAVRCMSLRRVTVDSLGVLVDGHAVPITPLDLSTDGAAPAYGARDLRPFGRMRIGIGPEEFDRRAALVLGHRLHTGVDLQGFSRTSAGRTSYAREHFTW